MRNAAELGKAIKTIFLCRNLHSKELRREINEGLNVVEQWNSAIEFVFFARHGEMVSNRAEDHEISMLALHLIRNCMVYIPKERLSSVGDPTLFGTGSRDAGVVARKKVRP